jgi:hypothetical protein
MKTAKLILNLSLAVLLGGASLHGQSPSELEEAGLALGLRASELREGHVATFALSELGLEVTRVKGVTADGTILRRDLMPDGQTADLDALLALEQALIEREPVRKLDPALRARVADAPAGERLPVIAWIACDTDALDAIARDRFAPFAGRTPTRDEARAAGRDEREAVLARVGEAVGTVQAALEAQGIAVRFRSRSAPVLVLDLTADELLRVAARTDVRALALDDLQARDADDTANLSHRTTWVKSKGVTGAGVRVAILEDNGIDPSCPYLAVSGWFNTFIIDPDDHVHGTAGCVASQKSDRPGAAPDVTLLCANAYDYDFDDVVDAADWIADVDADITNLSWGGNDESTSINSHDAFFDYESRYLRDSFVAAAGNSDDGPAVASSGKGYNVITVGNFNESSDWSWSNDYMSSSSGWVDPSNGCGKPNIAANGSTVAVLSYPAPWTDDSASGTSFASPHAAGNLADAMAVNSELMLYPEEAMALMMATAWNNIEGAELLSDLDGAGGIDGYAAYQCAKDDRLRAGYFTSADFTSTHIESIYLEGGQLTRVCVAWASETFHIFGTSYITALTTDLDIQALSNPFGSTHVVLASSSSIDDNYEILSFTPSATGWYRIGIADNGTVDAGESQPWGMAWTQSGDMNFVTFGEKAKYVPTGGGYFSGPTIGWPGFEFVMPGVPGQTYVAAPTGTPGGGFMTGGQWIPLVPDLITSLWLSTAAGDVPWKDSIGASGLDGLAAIGLALPGNANLIGKPIVHTALLLDAQVAIEAVGRPFVRTILPPPQPVPDTPGPALVALPFSVPFFGASYDQVFVSEDGYVTLGQPDVAPVESIGALLSGPPRIAVLWDDLDRHAPGAALQKRLVTQGNEQLVVEWIHMDELGPGASHDVTARLVLHGNGVIELHYAGADVHDGIVGLSPGNGLSDAAPIDLTSGEHTGAADEALYEVFGPQFAPFDLGAMPQANDSLLWNELRFVPGENGGYRLDVTLH